MTPKPPQLVQCRKCRGVGEPLFKGHGVIKKRAIATCRYCNSINIVQTKEAVSVPYWYTGTIEQRPEIWK